MITPRNILIARTDRIGDVVLSLPLAGIVKKHFPDCRVSFLVRNYTKDLVENHPQIDEVILLEEKNGKVPIIKNVRKLRKKSFDTGVIVYPTLVTALIVFLSQIKIRIGSGYRWYSFLFNKRIFEHRKYAEKHELEFNVNLLKPLGIEEAITTDNVKFGLRINEKSLERVKNILNEQGVDLQKDIILVHPGSGGSSVDLPITKFTGLVKNLSSGNDVAIILTGSEDDIESCNSIAYDSKVTSLAGRFNLSELIALISLCDIFISNSTGPIHIAAALGKKAIGFYPKIPVNSKERWGPYTKNKVVFEPEIECSDCTREQCEKLDCMNSINVDNVKMEIEKFLERNKIEK
jgi:lipopolysaccharide heptosyltransferase II